MVYALDYSLTTPRTTAWSTHWTTAFLRPGLHPGLHPGLQTGLQHGTYAQNSTSRQSSTNIITYAQDPTPRTPRPEDYVQAFGHEPTDMESTPRTPSLSQRR